MLAGSSVNCGRMIKPCRPANAAASSDRPAPAQRVRQRAAIDVFEVTTHGHAMGNAGDFHVLPACHLSEIVGRGLTFHRGIGGDDQFLDVAAGKLLMQQIKTQLLRADAIER